MTPPVLHSVGKPRDGVQRCERCMFKAADHRGIAWSGGPEDGPKFWPLGDLTVWGVNPMTLMTGTSDSAVSCQPITHGQIHARIASGELSPAEAADLVAEAYVQASTRRARNALIGTVTAMVVLSALWYALGWW